MKLDTIAEKLKFIRKKSDLSIEQWSRLLLMSDSTITSVEGSKRKPSLDYIHRVVNLFFHSLGDDSRRFMFTDHLLHWFCNPEQSLDDDALLIIGTVRLRPIQKSSLYGQVSFDTTYVGNAIRFVRKQLLDVSADKLFANRKPYTFRNIHNYERGLYKPNWETIAHICRESRSYGLAFRCILGMEEPEMYSGLITRPSGTVEQKLSRIFVRN